MKKLLVPVIGGVSLYITATTYSKLVEKGVISEDTLPKPLEWFLLGAVSCIGTQAMSWSLQKIQPTNGLAGFGESVEELDTLIDKYQRHIADLRKVLTAGSPAGKIEAQKKLAQEEKVLSDLLERREDLVQD